jgi:hypothetical protein
MRQMQAEAAKVKERQDAGARLMRKKIEGSIRSPAPKPPAPPMGKLEIEAESLTLRAENEHARKACQQPQNQRPEAATDDYTVVKPGANGAEAVVPHGDNVRGDDSDGGGGGDGQAGFGFDIAPLPDKLKTKLGSPSDCSGDPDGTVDRELGDGSNSSLVVPATASPAPAAELNFAFEMEADDGGDQSLAPAGEDTTGTAAAAPPPSNVPALLTDGADNGYPLQIDAPILPLDAVVPSHAIISEKSPFLETTKRTLAVSSPSPSGAVVNSSTATEAGPSVGMSSSVKTSPRKAGGGKGACLTAAKGASGGEPSQPHSAAQSTGSKEENSAAGITKDSVEPVAAETIAVDSGFFTRSTMSKSDASPAAKSSTDVATEAVTLPVEHPPSQEVPVAQAKEILDRPTVSVPMTEDDATTVKQEAKGDLACDSLRSESESAAGSALPTIDDPPAKEEGAPLAWDTTAQVQNAVELDANLEKKTPTAGTAKVDKSGTAAGVKTKSPNDAEYATGNSKKRLPKANSAAGDAAPREVRSPNVKAGERRKTRAKKPKVRNGGKNIVGRGGRGEREREREEIGGGGQF